MNAQLVRNSSALVLGISALGWSAPIRAQTVLVRSSEQPAPAPPPSPAPAPSSSTPAPVVIVTGSAPAIASEPIATPESTLAPAPAIAPEAAPLRLVTRPNRGWLMTGFFALAPAYVVSLAAATTSARLGDSNLWIPVLGPWLDLGARPSCPTVAGCGGMENANRVLLVADGILQTFGAFQIAGAFMWPETVGVPAFVAKSGASLSLTPARVGRDGYGLSGVGHF